MRIDTGRIDGRALAEEGDRRNRFDVPRNAGNGCSFHPFKPMMPDAADKKLTEMPDFFWPGKNMEGQLRETGQMTIRVLGRSRDTMTAGCFAAKDPEHLKKLILHTPHLCGVEDDQAEEPFHHPTGEYVTECGKEVRLQDDALHCLRSMQSLRSLHGGK